MKTFLLLLFIFVCSGYVLGQENAQAMKADSLVHKNVIKFLPVSLAFNSVGFEYERKFSPKNSFLFGLGLPTNKSFISKFYSDSNSSDNKVSDDQLGVMSIRAAFRHYTGHHTQAAGFYVSPYLKYQNYSVSAKSSHTTDLGVPFTEDIKADGNTMSVGLQLGTQWMIARRVCIDFYFLGIEAGIANLDGKVTSSSSDPSALAKMKKNVDDFINDLPSFIGDRFTTSQTGNTMEVKGNSVPFPWFRGGISIGIAF